MIAFCVSSIILMYLYPPNLVSQYVLVLLHTVFAFVSIPLDFGLGGGYCSSSALGVNRPSWPFAHMLVLAHCLATL